MDNIASIPTSNIQPVISIGGYSFENCFEEVNKVNNKKEGKGVILSVDDKITRAELSYHEGLLNGLCKFYDSNYDLVEEAYFKDDVKDGWFHILDKRKTKAEGFYSNGELYSHLRPYSKDPTFFEEYKENVTISVCKLNNNHNRHGLCYCYNNNELSSGIIFDDGKEVRTVYTFKGPNMTEFDESNNFKYDGQFKRDLFRFVREGQGKEYENGCLVYFGNWEHDMKNGEGSYFRERRKRYEGEWKDNEPHGQGYYLDDNGNIQYNGRWRKGYYEVEKGRWFYYQDEKIYKSKDVESELKLTNGTDSEDGDSLRGKYLSSDVQDNHDQCNVSVSSLDHELENGETEAKPMSDKLEQGYIISKSSDWNLISDNCIHFRVGSNCYNGMIQDLVICGYIFLQTITVETGSFQNIKSLKIFNNPNLEKIEWDGSNSEIYKSDQPIGSVELSSK